MVLAPSAQAENGAQEAEPVTIAECIVTVLALQGVNYVQDKGNDPNMDAGDYDAKHFYPSTTFTVYLVTEGNPKVGEWTIVVPEECAPPGEESVPSTAPASGL